MAVNGLLSKLNVIPKVIEKRMPIAYKMTL